MNQIAKLDALRTKRADTLSMVDAREHRLFRALDVSAQGTVEVGDLLDALRRVGLATNDARLHETMAALSAYSLRDRLSYAAFCSAVRPNILLIEQALQGGWSSRISRTLPTRSSASSTALRKLAGARLQTTSRSLRG